MDGKLPTTIDVQQLVATGQKLVTDFGVNVVAAIAILVIGRWVAKAITRAIKKLMHSRNVEDTLETFVGNVVYMGLLLFVIIAAVNQIGVQTTSIIAVIGAAGLAIGLALQGSLSNFAAGVLIITFKPYRVGDVIEVAGIIGTVTGVQIFTTSLVTGDNKLVIIPNSQVTNGVITNFSANETRRVDLVIGVSYSDDLDKVRAVIEAILAADARVLKDPAPTVAVQTLADSSVNFVVRPWVATADYWGVYFDLTEAIKKRFGQRGHQHSVPTTRRTRPPGGAGNLIRTLH